MLGLRIKSVDSTVTSSNAAATLSTPVPRSPSSSTSTSSTSTDTLTTYDLLKELYLRSTCLTKEKESYSAFLTDYYSFPSLDSEGHGDETGEPHRGIVSKTVAHSKRTPVQS